jgi:hypothetical protein
VFDIKMLNVTNEAFDGLFRSRKHEVIRYRLA